MTVEAMGSHTSSVNLARLRACRADAQCDDLQSHRQTLASGRFLTYGWTASMLSCYATMWSTRSHIQVYASALADVKTDNHSSQNLQMSDLLLGCPDSKLTHDAKAYTFTDKYSFSLGGCFVTCNRPEPVQSWYVTTLLSRLQSMLMQRS